MASRPLTMRNYSIDDISNNSCTFNLLIHSVEDVELDSESICFGCRRRKYLRTFRNFLEEIDRIGFAYSADKAFVQSV